MPPIIEPSTLSSTSISFLVIALNLSFILERLFSGSFDEVITTAFFLFSFSSRSCVRLSAISFKNLILSFFKRSLTKFLVVSLPFILLRMPMITLSFLSLPKMGLKIKFLSSLFASMVCERICISFLLPPLPRSSLL